jgi:hypothetical protein
MKSTSISFFVYSARVSFISATGFVAHNDKYSTVVNTHLNVKLYKYFALPTLAAN